MKKSIIVYIALVIFLCTSCGVIGNEEKTADRSISKASLVNSDCTVLDISDATNVYTKNGNFSEIELKECGSVIEINNNLVSDAGVRPYRGGFIYYDYSREHYVWDDMKGTIIELNHLKEANIGKEMVLICAREDTVFYIDGQTLKMNSNGSTKEISDLFYGAVFLGENEIYYATNYELYNDNNVTYWTSVYKVDYEGNNKQEICRMNVTVSQLYVYEDKIWYVFGAEDSGASFGYTSLRGDNFIVYKDIHPHNICINNDYMYFIGSNNVLKRMNVNTSIVERLTVKEGVYGISFTPESVLFNTDKGLYRFDGKDFNLIKKASEDEGLGHVSVFGDYIFIDSYLGGFNWKLEQIDIDGNIIKTLTATY